MILREGALSWRERAMILRVGALFRRERALSLRVKAQTLREEENIQFQAKTRDSAWRVGSIILFETADELFPLQ